MKATTSTKQAVASTKQAVKKLITGTPLEGVARRVVRDRNAANEAKQTMDAILRYTDPVPRYGEGRPSHPELTRLISAGREGYASLLGDFARFRDDFSRIPDDATEDNTQPHWENGWLPRLDAIALYSLLATTNPSVYLEVGSGNSTRFARRSIRDHGLRTKIVSIDPAPRADVNTLCDEVIRSRLETVDIAATLGSLGPGDIVFLDGSHRSFMNSDTTVFFLEVLPHVPTGGLVHIHDIFLPDDYPSAWKDRFYTEQYLLAAWLLGGSKGYEVHCPNHFISHDDEFREALRVLGSDQRTTAIDSGGPGSFWLRRVD